MIGNDKGEKLTSWQLYSAEVKLGMDTVQTIVTPESGPLPVPDVINEVIDRTQLCRARVANAIAELVDDQVIHRHDRMLEFTSPE